MGATRRARGLSRSWLSWGAESRALTGSATRLVRICACALLVLASGLGFVFSAQAQMPDLRQMSGQPLPSGELPVGSVSVRVVRGAVTNNIPDQDVTLEGGGPAQTVKTDASGRALFSGLPPNSIWRARATVDGERLESQAITIPSSGGVRVLLAAGLGVGQGGPSTPGTPGASPAAPSSGTPATGAAAAPAVPGTVAFGSQSRLVIELAEGSVEVYGLFDIVNTKPTPVTTEPIVFDTPAEARGTSVLEGSTPQAKASDHRVTVTGPFASGATQVQIAYRLPYDGSELRLRQVVPLGLSQTTVIVRKFGDLRAAVEGATGQREVPLEGRTYLITNGKAVRAGEAIDVTLSGLPHAARWPRYTALGIVALLIIGGVVFALQSPRRAQVDDELRALRARRAERFEQLVAIERRLARGGSGQEALQARRAALFAEIEALDDAIATAAAEAPVIAEATPPEHAERLGARPAVR